MRWLKALARLGIHQTGNLAKLLMGRPLTILPLGSTTLDRDDVELARQWLQDGSMWWEKDIVSEYENRFAHWNGSRYACAFMGGRVALSAIIYALNLKPGDEVIIPGYTCVVVPNAFRFANVDIAFADIELETYGLDVVKVEEKISDRTRAIMIQHLYGLVCRDYDALLDLARRRNLKVIEDCAHVTGAEYKGQKVGNFGDAALYSSEQSKVFTTIQGGLAVTNDETIKQKLRAYADKAPYPDKDWIYRQLYTLLLNYYCFKHPQRWWLGDLMELRYGAKRLISTTREEEQGIKPAHYGRKMPAPIAALGLNQLKKLDRYNELRRQGARRWDAWCEENGYAKPLVIPESVPVFLRYPVLVEPEKKANPSWMAKDLGVQPGVWFTGKAHRVELPEITGCPNADLAVAQCVNFPTVLE